MASPAVNHDIIYCVSIECTRVPVDTISDLLESHGFEDHAAWEDEESGNGSVRFCRESSSDAKQLCQSLALLLDEQGMGDLPLEIIDLEKEDWTSSWKKFFHAAKVSRRMVIRPSWEHWIGAEDDIEVIIDPGMSFGTGLHPTTRGCISFLDEVAVSGGSFLDAGCGSGILSICAKKLGYGLVEAFDIDEVAVECSEVNLASNGISEGVHLHHLGLQDYQPEMKFDTVAVNILAPVILANCDRITDYLGAGSKLLLAGILTTKFDEVVGQFASRGVQMLERIDDEEWTSGLFELVRPVAVDQ
jgi:ribosomal protein L11 methyltransferase